MRVETDELPGVVRDVAPESKPESSLFLLFLARRRCYV